jgi:hypothetical protein
MADDNLRCTATTHGRPCRARPLRGSRYCFNHDPAAAEARTKARRAGGDARGRQQQAEATAAGADGERPWWKELRQPWEVGAALAHVAREVIAGRMDARRATAAIKALGLLAPLTERYYRRRDGEEGGDGEETVDSDGNGGERLDGGHA